MHGSLDPVNPDPKQHLDWFSQWWIQKIVLGEGVWSCAPNGVAGAKPPLGDLGSKAPPQKLEY